MASLYIYIFLVGTAMMNIQTNAQNLLQVCMNPQNCPQVLYEDRKNKSNRYHQFIPCQEQCALCEEGSSPTIEGWDCSSSNELGFRCALTNMGNVWIHDNANRDETSANQMGSYNFQITMSYRCRKGTISIRLIPPSKQVTIPVTVNIHEVRLSVPSSEIHLVEGERLHLECILVGPVPAGNSVTIFYNQKSTDLEELKYCDAVVNGTTRINQTHCDLDINNCQTTDSGIYSCVISISDMGIFQSEKITVTCTESIIYMSTNTPPENSNDRIILGGSIGGAAFIFIVIVVITTIIITTTITRNYCMPPPHNEPQVEVPPRDGPQVAEGPPPDGPQAEGLPPEGPPPDGPQAEGLPPEGPPPDGPQAEGLPPEGRPPDGPPAEGPQPVAEQPINSLSASVALSDQDNYNEVDV